MMKMVSGGTSDSRTGSIFTAPGDPVVGVLQAVNISAMAAQRRKAGEKVTACLRARL
jgi:hypothetical protein